MVEEWSSWAGLSTGTALVWAAVTTVWVAVYDLRWRRIPDRIILPALVVVPSLLALAALMPARGMWQSPSVAGSAGGMVGGSPEGNPWLIGVIDLSTGLGLGVAFALAHLALAMAGGLGGGDVKLALLFGILLGCAGGWGAVWWGGVLSWGGAGLAALTWPELASRSDGLPFAPFLVLGCWPVIATPW